MIPKTSAAGRLSLVELAGEMFALQSRYADASVSGYRDEYREIVRTTAREHSALPPRRPAC